MVVFTCNHCGESLQKPKVEKHYQFVCRTVKNLTCVDCFKDFRGEEYNVHNKCITEEERYSAKGSIPNGIVKKGEVKQESWVEMIKNILDHDKNMLPSHRNLLNSIAAFSNVPRKKPKFINFVKSSSGGRANMKDVEAVWDIIEKHKNSSKPQSDNKSSCKNESEEKSPKHTKADNTELEETADKSMKKKKKKSTDSSDPDDTNSTEDDPPKKKKKQDNSELNETKNEDSPKKNKKRKADLNGTDHSCAGHANKRKNKTENDSLGDENEPPKSKKKIETAEEAEATKFDYGETITKILKEKPKISVRKLEKRFLKLYSEQHDEVDLEKVSKRFNKRLKKLDNVKIENDTVTYTQ